MKLSAWWDKDRMHLRDLIDAGLVTESMLPSLPEPLRDRLQLVLENE